MKRYFLLFLFFHSYCLTQAPKIFEPESKTHPEWSRPFPPFRIVGNLYYVGTADLACYLIVTTKGNILINTGLASSDRLLNANVKTLGFKLSDKKVLLTTQAHFDHIGAMAEIKKVTGAKMMVDCADSAVVADGGGLTMILTEKFVYLNP